MVFDDGFSYSAEETTKLVKRRVFHYIRAQFNKSKKQNKPVVISGVKLVESVLSSFNIVSFDFFNNETYLKVENAFKETINFLIEKGFITSSVQGKDRFYKFFIRKELFRTREFSNEFEVNMVISFMYNLGFSFRYEISQDFVNFHKQYFIDELIKYSAKKIVVDFPNVEDFVVLAIKGVEDWEDVKAVVAKNDYALYGEFVSTYNHKTKVVKVVSTKKEQTKEDKFLYTRLVVVANSDSDIKKEFEY